MGDHPTHDFEKRAARIDRTLQKGGGFEAQGTLGRKPYKPRKRKTPRFGVVRAICLVALVAWMMKAGFYILLGPIDYNLRLSNMIEGTPIEQYASVVMRPDHVSIGAAKFLTMVFDLPQNISLVNHAGPTRLH